VNQGLIKLSEENSSPSTGSRFVLLIAGMSRSGSTWTFNSARLLLSSICADVYAIWFKDYDYTYNATVQIIKVDKPEDASDLRQSKIITTFKEAATRIRKIDRSGYLCSHYSVVS
jgi:hypothetical protein